MAVDIAHAHDGGTAESDNKINLAVVTRYCQHMTFPGSDVIEICPWEEGIYGFKFESTVHLTDHAGDTANVQVAGWFSGYFWHSGKFFTDNLYKILRGACKEYDTIPTYHTATKSPFT